MMLKRYKMLDQFDDEGFFLIIYYYLLFILGFAVSIACFIPFCFAHHEHPIVIQTDISGFKTILSNLFRFTKSSSDSLNNPKNERRINDGLNV